MSSNETVFFTLGKFNFTAASPVTQWLGVFALPAAYLTVLLLAIIIDVSTCERCCARLRSGKEADSAGLLEEGSSAKDAQQKKSRKEKESKRAAKESTPTRHNLAWGFTASDSGNRRGEVSNKTKAQKAFVFEQVKKGRVFLGPKTMFLMHKRTFRDFHPTALRKMPAPSTALRTPYEASRKTLYCTFLNTVFATALRPSVIITCVAGLWAWGVYVLRSMVSDETLVYIDNDRHSDSSFGDSVVVQFDNDTAEESIAYFLQNLDRMAGLTALVQGYMSFMLVYYALQSLLLWNSTYAQMRRLAVQFENLGLFFSNFTMQDDGRTRHVKFTLYRYLNLLHFFLYASNVEFLMSDFKTVLTRQLVRVGLMEQREKEIIDDSQFPVATLNSWLTALIWDRGQWLAPRLARLRLLDILTNINNSHTDLSVTMNSSPPYSWAQLMRLLVDVYLILTPFAFVSDMYMPTADAQVWPLVGTFIVCMFLQGLMGFVRFLKQPFGNGRDAFNPDALLLEVEHKLLFWLSNHNDDPLYHPDSPEMRYRALARAKAVAEKEAAKKPQEFFGMD